MGKAVLVTFRWRRNAINGAFSLLARAGRYATDLRAARARVDVHLDVAYGPHPVAHRLDVYAPRFAARPLPVLMYVHGGAFMLCSKETHAALALLNAVQSDYLVFNINYRLAPRHPFPAAIADTCAAYRWVVAHAHEYGGDPARIVVAGESAGGNLALGVAIAASYERTEDYARAVYATGAVPVAVMPVMPYLQVTEPSKRARCEGGGYFAAAVAKDIAAAYLQGRTRPRIANEMADPVRVLESGTPSRPFPRVFTGVGTADICCSDVRRLERACRHLGIPMAAFYYENEMHAFHALRWRAAAIRFWRESVAFLRQVATLPRLPLAKRRPTTGWPGGRRAPRAVPRLPWAIGLDGLRSATTRAAGTALGTRTLRRPAAKRG